MSVVLDRLLSHFWGRDLSQPKAGAAASLKSKAGGLCITDQSRGGPDSERERTNKQRETVARVLPRSRKWSSVCESLREIDLNPRSRRKIRISLQF